MVKAPYKSNQYELGINLFPRLPLKHFKTFWPQVLVKKFPTHSKFFLFCIFRRRKLHEIPVEKSLDKIFKNSLSRSSKKCLIKTFCMLNNLWSENKESRIWRKTKTNLTKWILLSNLSVQLHNLEYNTLKHSPEPKKLNFSH